MSCPRDSGILRVVFIDHEGSRWVVERVSRTDLAMLESRGLGRRGYGGAGEVLTYCPRLDRRRRGFGRHVDAGRRRRPGGDRPLAAAKTPLAISPDHHPMPARTDARLACCEGCCGPVSCCCDLLDPGAG